MENSILKKISKFIIDQRMLVMIVFAAALLTVSFDGDETERFPTEYDALNELSYTRDGSRIVFTLENGGSVVLLSAQRVASLLLPIAVAVVVAAGVAAFFVVRKKKAAKNKTE